jgi:putative heme iron utilization protein
MEELMADAGAIFQGRTLLRAGRAATLATTTHGQPFAALVTPATAPDLAPLLLLSSLSEHTRHLLADPRCALLVAGAAETANPQTAPRLCLTGVAEMVEDAALKARWLAIHPYAALYADFADFGLWRIRPGGALLVGGFARATRLAVAELLPASEAVAAVEAAEPGIIAHCNQDHADAMAALGGGGIPWRMVAVDVDGFDLAPAAPDGGATRRIAWPAPVASAGDVRTALITLLRAARGENGGHNGS